jgi:hypothetical protein
LLLLLEIDYLLCQMRQQVVSYIGCIRVDVHLHTLKHARLPASAVRDRWRKW